MPHNVLLLSGGIDSLVLLSHLRSAMDLCLTFDYGQRHRREIEAAKAIAGHYGIAHEIVTLPPLRGSALTRDGDVPVGVDATDPAQSATVVPNRNMIMLAIAANYAGSGGMVYLGTNKNDHTIYPDCRPAFLQPVGEALFLGCNVRFDAPFSWLDKSEIVSIGKRNSAPLYLAWSCYLGGEVQCGQCAACLGVRQAGVRQ